MACLCYCLLGNTFFPLPWTFPLLPMPLLSPICSYVKPLL